MYDILMYAHLITIMPCIFLGLFALMVKKSNPYHRKVGWVYMILMMTTSIIALFLPAKVGHTWLNHFGWIHLFCILTLVSIPRALYTIRRGKVFSHKMAMIMLYVGAIGIAGAFTLVPGRFLHQLFFGG